MIGREMNKVLERVTGHGNGMGTEGVSLVLVLVFECLLFTVCWSFFTIKTLASGLSGCQDRVQVQRLASKAMSTKSGSVRRS